MWATETGSGLQCQVLLWCSYYVTRWVSTQVTESMHKSNKDSFNMSRQKYKNAAGKNRVRQTWYQRQREKLMQVITSNKPGNSRIMSYYTWMELSFSPFLTVKRPKLIGAECFLFEKMAKWHTVWLIWFDQQNIDVQYIKAISLSLTVCSQNQL